jgi:hypothetical protein
VNRADVLPCGCYAAAVPKRDIMLWVRAPSMWGGDVLVNEKVGAEIERLGRVTMNGVPAEVRRDKPECPHYYRLWFNGAWDPSYGMAA